MTVDLLEGKGMCSFLPLHQKHPMSPASPIEEVCVCVCVSHSVASDSFQPRTVAHQAPLSVEFSRQEYWSALPFPSPGDLPDPGIEPVPLTSPSLGSLPLLLLSRFSHVQLFATPWTAAFQAPPSVGFSRQEYWSGVPLPSPTCTVRFH